MGAVIDRASSLVIFHRIAPPMYNPPKRTFEDQVMTGVT